MGFPLLTAIQGIHMDAAVDIGSPPVLAISVKRTLDTVENIVQDAGRQCYGNR